MKALFLCDDCAVDQVAPLARQHGHGIEIQAFYNPRAADAADSVPRHRHALTEIPSERRSLHGPFGDLCPGSFDEMVRGVTRHRIDLGYTKACELDISRLILHHGYVPGTSAPSGWLRRSTAFWGAFLYDKPANLRVHIENVFERDPDLIAELIAAVDDPRLSICLDLGHCYCHAKTPTVEWVRCLGPLIGYVHMHDNHGDTDSHLPLGQGTLPLADVCAALNEHAPSAIWALEVGPEGMAESLEWLNRNGFL